MRNTSEEPKGEAFTDERKETLEVRDVVEQRKEVKVKREEKQL